MHRREDVLYILIDLPCNHMVYVLGWINAYETAPVAGTV